MYMFQQFYRINEYVKNMIFHLDDSMEMLFQNFLSKFLVLFADRLDDLVLFI